MSSSYVCGDTDVLHTSVVVSMPSQSDFVPIVMVSMSMSISLIFIVFMIDTKTSSSLDFGVDTWFADIYDSLLSISLELFPPDLKII